MHTSSFQHAAAHGHLSCGSPWQMDYQQCSSAHLVVLQCCVGGHLHPAKGFVYVLRSPGLTTQVDVASICPPSADSKRSTNYTLGQRRLQMPLQLGRDALHNYMVQIDTPACYKADQSAAPWYLLGTRQRLGDHTAVYPRPFRCGPPCAPPPCDYRTTSISQP